MYHSLSYCKIYKKWKYKGGGRRTTNLDYPKLQHGEENYPKTTWHSVYPHLQNPTGVFIGTRGKGGQGTNPGPKYGRGRARTGAKMRHRLRFRGSSRAARCPVCLLSDAASGFWFWAPGFNCCPWLFISGLGRNGQSFMTWVRDWQLKQFGTEVWFTRSNC